MCVLFQLDSLEMLLEEESHSVIKLVLQQLVLISIASVTLLAIVGPFLVAKVFERFFCDSERTYFSDRLCGNHGNVSVVSFVSVQEGMKVLIEENSTYHPSNSDGVPGFKFCGHVQYCYICQQALTDLARHLQYRLED